MARSRRCGSTGCAKSDLRESHFVFAGGAAETIDGTGGRDDLFGAGGADTINGRGGDDRLFGENGADTLSGGGGRDSLVGGRRPRRADRRRSGPTASSSTAPATPATRGGTADRITDFVADLDLLVLAGIDAREGRPGNQAFSFIDDDAFDARRPGPGDRGRRRHPRRAEHRRHAATPRR